MWSALVTVPISRIKLEGFWLTVQDYTKTGKVKTGDLNNWSHCISRQEEEGKEGSAHFSPLHTVQDRRLGNGTTQMIFPPQLTSAQ